MVGSRYTDLYYITLSNALRVTCIVFVLTASWLMLQDAARTIHDSTSAALEGFGGGAATTHAAVPLPTTCVSTYAALEIFNGGAATTYAAAPLLTTCVFVCVAPEIFNGRAVTTHAVAPGLTTGVSTDAAMADWSSDVLVVK